MFNGVKPELIIFDFWGTLAFFSKTDLKELYLSLKDFGIGLKDEIEIKRFSFLFSQSMFLSENWTGFSERLLKYFTENPTEERIRSFADFLKEKIVFKLYDDVKEALELPFKKAILTDSAKFLVENSGLQKWGPIFTPKEAGVKKPHPKMFLTVLEKLKVGAKKVLMVGDDIERDMVPAQNVGMDTVLIDRDNKFPDYAGNKIKSLGELKNILKEGL